jgi:hypothetical protein
MLWASALVIAALIVVQLGKYTQGSPNAARADVVTRVQDYTALTFNAGNDDVLLVLDGRGEQLFMYRVKNQNTVEFIDKLMLPEVFETTKRLGAGRK